MDELYRNYIGLLIVITLWVIVWYSLTALGKYFAENYGHKLLFLLFALGMTSFALLKFYPERTSIRTVNVKI